MALCDLLGASVGQLDTTLCAHVHDVGVLALPVTLCGATVTFCLAARRFAIECVIVHYNYSTAVHSPDQSSL